MWRRVRAAGIKRRETAHGRLHWLEAQGESPHAVIEPFLADLSRRALGPAGRLWVTSFLSSGSRWRSHGPDVMAALLRKGSLEQVCPAGSGMALPPSGPRAGS